MNEEQIKDIFEQEVKKADPFDTICEAWPWTVKEYYETAMLATIKRVLAVKNEKECTNCGHLFAGESDLCDICKDENI